MLEKNMSLRQMVDFSPNDEEMAMLDLDVVLYLKVSIISIAKEDNYDFIRFFFQDPDLKDFLKEINKTIIYDFDYQERFITIFECLGTKNYFQTSEYLKELMENYEMIAEVIIDIYTHDNKTYRLSNLDGVVKLEEINQQKNAQSPPLN